MNGKNIPEMKSPSKGPPTIPNILNMIWNSRTRQIEDESTDDIVVQMNRKS